VEKFYALCNKHKLPLPVRRETERISLVMMQTVSSLISKQNKALVFLSSSNRVIYQNQLAQSLFEQPDGFRVEQGKLVNSCSERNEYFLISLRNTKIQLLPSTIFWESSINSYPERIDIFPILDELVADAVKQPRAMVLMDAPRKGKTLIKSQFLEFYHLTPAEVDVVALLVRGLSLNECAQKRKITVSTVRWTLGNIFSKTSTSSQKELLRVANLFAD